jgi:hypothetical protein
MNNFRERLIESYLEHEISGFEFKVYMFYDITLILPIRLDKIEKPHSWKFDTNKITDFSNLKCVMEVLKSIYIESNNRVF